MLVTFVVAFAVSLVSGYFFFTAQDRRSRTIEGLVATGAMMICLGIAPFPVQVLLLLGIFGMEQWRVRWEARQEQ